jgi:hypothetical protein
VAGATGLVVVVGGGGGRVKENGVAVIGEQEKAAGAGGGAGVWAEVVVCGEAGAVPRAGVGARSILISGRVNWEINGAADETRAGAVGGGGGADVGGDFVVNLIVILGLLAGAAKDGPHLADEAGIRSRAPSPGFRVFTTFAARTIFFRVMKGLPPAILSDFWRVQKLLRTGCVDGVECWISQVVN